MPTRWPHKIITRDDADVEGNLAVTGTSTLTGAVTATGAITANGGVVGAVTGAGSNEIVTGANTITAAESGKTFFLNAATGFASTLPAPAAGLRFRFIVGATAPTSGGHTVVTNANATIIQGSVTVNGAAIAGANEDTITFAASTALSGDWAEVVSDGTNWYVSGQAVATGAITLTDAA